MAVVVAVGDGDILDGGQDEDRGEGEGEGEGFVG